MIKPHRLLITTGDVDGIGLEVTGKALAQWKSRPFEAIVLVNAKAPKAHFRKWSGGFPIYRNLTEALKQPRKRSQVSWVLSESSPALWIEPAAKACLHGDVDALVTGPLSKPAIHEAGLDDVGHTDILKRVCAAPDAFMAFAGNSFSVALLTGHIPVSSVESSLRMKMLHSLVQLIIDFLKPSRSRTKLKPIGILGLNPHSSDSGLIGNFENKSLLPWVRKLQQLGFPVEGPLVPDVAFQKSNWDKYSFFISLYHDQGLIPFKLVHGYDAAHFTLGLPMIRTSVDHGTAKDIFNKDIANPESMKAAIKLAADIVQKKKGALNV